MGFGANTSPSSAASSLIGDSKGFIAFQAASKPTSEESSVPAAATSSMSKDFDDDGSGGGWGLAASHSAARGIRGIGIETRDTNRELDRGSEYDTDAAGSSKVSRRQRRERERRERDADDERRRNERDLKQQTKYPLATPRRLLATELLMTGTNRNH